VAKHLTKLNVSDIVVQISRRKKSTWYTNSQIRERRWATEGKISAHL